MDQTLIALRAQDFHESLRGVGAYGPKDVKFRKTLLIGKAASLAMHLRGLLLLENMEQLEWAAASLGIGSLELPTVLAELQEVGFVRVVHSGDEIKRIEVRVPEFRSGYAELGRRWWDLKPNEIEQAGVGCLEELHQGPASLIDVQSHFSLSKTDFAVMADVMKSGNLLALQPLDGEQWVYTPLAVDGNASAYLKWAKHFPKEVQGVIGTLNQYQGLPVNDPMITDSVALREAIATGVLMPVTVNGATGAQKFVFAPRGGIQPTDRTILDKARAVLSCVRYGQRFAEGRPIRMPRRILETLIENKRFSRGHPDLLTQYGLLAEKLIGHPIDEGYGRWNFCVDDTPENMKALQIANDMLEWGATPSAHIDLEAEKALMSASGYLCPATTRPKMLVDAEVSTETRTAIVREMAKITRGMAPHV